MKAKSWGIVLIIIGILITLISSLVKIYRDVVVGCTNCSYMVYMIIWFIGGIIFALGFLLRRSEELQDHIKESQLKQNKEFKEAKQKERLKQGFQEFLRDFGKQEVEVVELLHTYEGISQSELQKNLSFSKETLAKILKKLEKQKVITIMPSKKLYLIKLRK